MMNTLLSSRFSDHHFEYFVGNYHGYCTAPWHSNPHSVLWPCGERPSSDFRSDLTSELFLSVGSFTYIHIINCCVQVKFCGLAVPWFNFAYLRIYFCWLNRHSWINHFACTWASLSTPHVQSQVEFTIDPATWSPILTQPFKKSTKTRSCYCTLRQGARFCWTFMNLPQLDSFSHFRFSSDILAYTAVFKSIPVLIEWCCSISACPCLLQSPRLAILLLQLWSPSTPALHTFIWTALIMQQHRWGGVSLIVFSK